MWALHETTGEEPHTTKATLADYGELYDIKKSGPGGKPGGPWYEATVYGSVRPRPLFV